MSAPSSLLHEREPDPRQSAFDPLLLGAGFSLLLVLILRGAWEWRFVHRFLGDHGWYFQVAERVAAGEMLYRDVGWDYGPLPIYALGVLFEISESLAWQKVLDLLLAGASVCAVFFIARRFLGGRGALWLAGWAALLGPAKGLVSDHLEAYTNAVAWGTATSLLATSAACRWVGGGRLATLAATGLLAVASVLSKPEFGLAGASVLAGAVLLRRPPRNALVAATAAAAAVVAVIGFGTSPATLHAWWRGYSGYDLIAVGQVPLANPPRMLAALGAGVILGLSVASKVVRFGAVAVVTAFVVHALWIGRPVRLLFDLATLGASAVWVAAVPALLWLAWSSRGAVLARELWIVCAFAVVVNLRPFLYGDFCAAAAGPVAAVALHAVRHHRIPRPSRWGIAVLAVFVLLVPVREEKRSLAKPWRSERVETEIGIARVPSRIAAEIREVRAILDSAPPGPLFVWGGGPGWYLASGRRNPTRFDVLLDGLGVTEPEVSRLFEDLRSNPPSVVILERDSGISSYSRERLWADLGTSYAHRYTTRSGRWDVFVAAKGSRRTVGDPGRQEAPIDGVQPDT